MFLALLPLLATTIAYGLQCEDFSGGEDGSSYWCVAIVRSLPFFLSNPPIPSHAVLCTIPGCPSLTAQYALDMLAVVFACQRCSVKVDFGGPMMAAHAPCARHDDIYLLFDSDDYLTCSRFPCSTINRDSLRRLRRLPREAALYGVLVSRLQCMHGVA